jgi:hypothetical protein
MITMRGSSYQIQGLRDMIRYMKKRGVSTSKKKMIEIGSYLGESTAIFCEYFSLVVAIDPFIGGYDEDDMASSEDFNQIFDGFLHNTKKFNNLLLLRETSDRAFEILKGNEFDFVYIDGVHTKEQVRKDITKYTQLIKPSGYIAGHDYSDNAPGVVTAVNLCLERPDETFIDSSWIKSVPLNRLI